MYVLRGSVGSVVAIVEEHADEEAAEQESSRGRKSPSAIGLTGEHVQWIRIG
jgi:hypothetical protein